MKELKVRIMDAKVVDRVEPWMLIDEDDYGKDLMVHLTKRIRKHALQNNL